MFSEEIIDPTCNGCSMKSHVMLSRFKERDCSASNHSQLGLDPDQKHVGMTGTDDLTGGVIGIGYNNIFKRSSQ